ncbi:aminopeptidase [candidate division TA06 bacterium]|nr:aminopeptidase [candidate division TA06 bacterium]
MELLIQKHAQVITRYCLDLKKGEKVLIQGAYVTYPLMKECFRAALELGAHPQVRISNEELSEIMLQQGSEDQIKFIHENDLTAYKTFDVFLTLMGTINTRLMSNVDPAKSRLASQSGAPVMQIMMERMAKGEARWCGTMHPNWANAQEASMSLADYQDFVYGSCYLSEADPVARWKQIHSEQQRLCDLLDKKKTLRIISRDTDLKMSIAGRKWVNCSGHQNFPDGEVFTGPVEDTVEGTIRFSYPGIFMGREVEDIRLTFEKGKVVKASAGKGGELLNQILETDPGARFVGEIAVGTNYNIKKFTRNMLFDEKIGGTVHLAIGRSLHESGGKNVSSVHWDMLCDMKEGGKIFADDELVYENGKFII